jgi:hypothetical protein
MFARYTRELASGHYRLFLACLAVMLLHFCDDAFVQEESGSGLGSKLAAAGLGLLLVAVGAVLYPLLWRRVRPALVALYGLLALGGAWQAHISHALDEGASGGDYTGFLYALAGLVLLGLAGRLALEIVRRRPAAPAEP